MNPFLFPDLGSAAANTTRQQRHARPHSPRRTRRQVTQCPLGGPGNRRPGVSRLGLQGLEQTHRPPRLPSFHSTHKASKKKGGVSTGPGFESIKLASEKPWTSASMLLGTFECHLHSFQQLLEAFWEPCWAAMLGFIRHQSLGARASRALHRGAQAAENPRSSARGLRLPNFRAGGKEKRNLECVSTYCPFQ